MSEGHTPTRRTPSSRERPGRSGAALAPPVLLVVLALLAVMGVRLAGPCDGDPGCFVVAGVNFTDPAEAGIPALTGAGADGYDGQFFWRLSRSPDELQQSEVHGVALDSPIRAGRPGYPAVVWVLSAGGRKGLVDWTLILVNLTATALLSMLLGATALRNGLSPWLGAAAALWPGLLFAVGRDLSEPGAALLIVVGLAALNRNRPELAGLAWVGAVLWREQSIVVPAAFGACWLVQLLRTGGTRSSLRQVTAWLAPLAAFLSWQAIALQAVGKAPVLESGEANASIPLADLARAAAGWVSFDEGVVGLVWLIELCLVLAIVAAALVVALRDRRWEGVAVLFGIALLVSASENVWSGPAHLRYATDLVMTAWFLLLTTTVRQRGQAQSRPVEALARAGGFRAVLVGAQLGAATLASSFLVRTF